jgi:clan AA aspartic protease
VIVGSVNAALEIKVPILIRDSAGQLQMIEASLDTGFNGALTLPANVVVNLGLPWISRSIATLANGATVQFDVHSAIVNWDGGPLSVLVQAVDPTPLLGTALLRHHDLRVRMVAGGRVEIEAVP